MDICKHFFEHLKESENTDLYTNLEQALQHLLWHIYDEKNNILKLIKDENTICNKLFIDYLKDIFAKYLNIDKELNEELALNHIVESFISALRWHIHNPNKLSLENLVNNFIRFNIGLIKK